jgi:hypothetical protein
MQQDRFQEICRKLSVNRKIVFHEMNLSVRFCQKLADKIIYDPHRFSILDLQKNSIGDSGVKVLMRGISHSKSIVYLNLASNDISNEGMISIFRGL